MDRDERASPKFGAGTGSAALRLGLTELRNALYPDSNVVAHHTETGMYGTATQFEVNKERQNDTPAIEGHSVLDDRMKQAEASRDDRGLDDRGKESKDIDRE